MPHLPHDVPNEPRIHCDAGDERVPCDHIIPIPQIPTPNGAMPSFAGRSDCAGFASAEAPGATGSSGTRGPAMLIESDDHDDDDQPRDAERTPMTRAVSTGRALPMVMLKRALGKRLDRFVHEKALCAVVRVRSDEWIAPLSSAARMLAEWRSHVAWEGTTKSRDQACADAIHRLSTGARVLFVVPASAVLPPLVMTAVDMVVDIDAISARDIANAIRAVTGGSVRGITDKDVASIELQHAISALRPGTTVAACIRRLRSSAGIVHADPVVGVAPPIEQLRGYGEAGRWAARLLKDLDRWRAGDLNFSQVERALVLAGPPGVGKTSFVRSLAKSAGLPLITSSIGQLFAGGSGYLDSICKSIDNIFEQAKAGRPSIVLLDELEGFPNRYTLDDRHASWWTAVTTHMLTSLDRALSPATANCIVVGASNFPERLDPALIRPGRLERIIDIGLPSEEDLAHIYRGHLGDELAGEDLSAVAAIAAGSTGAEAVGHINLARSVARAAGRPMAQKDLIEAICPPSSLSEADAWRAAVHEAGHATVATLLGTGSVRSLALTGGTGTGGRVVYRASGSAFHTSTGNRALVMQTLAGRAAEEVIIGDASGGAGGGNDSDLARASGLVAAAHLSLGLRGNLIYLAEPNDSLAFARRSPTIMATVEKELREIYARTTDLIRANAEALTVVAEILLQERVMTGDRLGSILATFRNPEGGGDA